MGKWQTLIMLQGCHVKFWGFKHVSCQVDAANAVDICSIELGCKMNFGIYLPPKAESTKVPVIYWLSGKNTSYYVFTL